MVISSGLKKSMPAGTGVCVVWPLAMPELVGDRRTDARAISQAIADAFERLISASPSDWHVFEPAWPADDG